MESNILCKKLNQTMGEIKFKVKKDNLTNEAICADVVECDKHLFSLRIYIEKSGFVRTYFDLGRIIYNDKALFLLNRFNSSCPGEFVSYITSDENSMFRGGYLHILVNIKEEDENKVAKLIDLATNKLFSPSMEKYLFPLIKLLKDSEIKNTKNMN